MGILVRQSHSKCLSPVVPADIALALLPQSNKFAASLWNRRIQTIYDLLMSGF